jgi:hypothetical protein
MTSKTEITRSNDSFERRAKRYLKRHAGLTGLGARVEWKYLLDAPATRVVRLTVLTSDGKIENIVETNDAAPTALDAFNWAIDRCGMTVAEAMRESRYDPREVSEGASDDFCEYAEELLELRARVDGMSEAARERGATVDEALAVELSALIDGVRNRVEEMIGR